ncbi:MAG: sporulation transcriptional regulator SpoIIID [Clostridia bacterium]|nr:sporulation transcriptional regulator SpoIIID [Clostridia bacterium]
MREYIEKRAVEFANYIIFNKTTVRDTAKVFAISKSTVHKDIVERLPKINKDLYMGVRKILEENKSQRHIRGGLATKNKYLAMRGDL